MKFRAAIEFDHGIAASIDKKFPSKFIFSRKQILFPKGYIVADRKTYLDPFEVCELSNGEPYKLTVIKDDKIKYQIQFGPGDRCQFFILPKGLNKIKMKWLHGLYKIQSETIATLTLIVLILTLVATVIIAVVKK